MEVSIFGLVCFMSILLCVNSDFSDITDNTVSIEQSLELTQALNLARQERIQEYCDHFGNNLTLDNIPANQLEHILVDDIHKLLYCYVPKAACTNWKRILMKIMGKWNGTNVLTLPGHVAHAPGMFRNLSSVLPAERDYLLENYHKMILARHPFQRVLSAYRNKLEGETPSKYFKDRVGRRIIKAFRENPSNESLEFGHDVSFSEFVQFLTSNAIELADISRNEHWQPITSLCHPCLIKYTLVGKYETLLDDAFLTLHTIGANHVQFPRVVLTSGTSEKLYRYYSQLELPLVRELYKLYKQDLALFDYDLKNIVDYDLD